MGLRQSWKRARRRGGTWALRATALAALPCAAPGWSAPTPPPLAVLVKTKLFGLADTRRIRAMPLRLKVSPAATDETAFGPDAPLPLDASEADGDLLTRFLAIREDLRFLINSNVENVSKERIALGLKFARSF